MTLITVNGTISSASDWNEAGAGFALPGVAATVTQPIKLTEVAGGTTPTFSLSGCAVTPTTVVGDGSTHNVTASSSCRLTITVPGDGPNTRERFASEATTTSFNTCPSGTCSGENIVYYFELNNTLAATPRPSGQLWESIAMTPTGTQSGTGSSSICTIDPISGTSTLATCSGWSDYGQQITFPFSVIGTHSDERWYGNGTRTFTPTTSANTYTVTYTDQYELSVIGGNGVTYSVPSQSSDNYWNVGTSLTVSSQGVWARSGGTGNRVSQWNIDGGAQTVVATTGTVTTSSITMSATHFVIFTNVVQFFLTLTAGAGGSVSYVTNPTITGDTGWYDTGTSVSFSATPGGGNTFTTWNGTGACSYSGSANPHSITLSCAATEAAVFTASTVTVQLQLDGPILGGGFTLAGCAVSPTTTIGDNTTHSFTADSSCTITVTGPADYFSGGVDSARVRFASGNNTVTFNSCPAGTCSVVKIEWYYQFYFTFYIQAEVPTTFTPSLSFPVNGTVLGIRSTALCTITSTAATYDYCHAWMDFPASSPVYPPGYIGYPDACHNQFRDSLGHKRKQSYHSGSIECNKKHIQRNLHGLLETTLQHIRRPPFSARDVLWVYQFHSHRD